MNSSKSITVPAVDELPSLGKTTGRWLDSLRGCCYILVSGDVNRRVHAGLGALCIFALVFLVYVPMLPGSFLMDDHRLIRDDNPLVNGEFTPFNLWFQTDFTLSTFALWLQWLVWGGNPAGYHAVNVALHGLGAVLLWRLLARLKIPGAWLAAALFAVHPVCVNSVARIAEIKNTLSLPFFILSFWFYLRYEKLSRVPAMEKQTAVHRWRDSAALWYGFSLVAFVLALMSKTSTVMLPLLLLAGAAWQRRRISWQDLWQTVPYFILSLGFGLMSAWFQNGQGLALIGKSLPPESVLERLAIAGRVFWFYLGKVLLPMNLTLVYERWKPDTAALSSFLPVLFLCAGFVLFWRFRHRWGRPLLFGLGCFLVTLFPVLGFFNSQFLTMWQVSDHLQYLPMIAPVALAVAGLAVFLNANTFRCAGFILVVILSVLTFQRAHIFATEEGLLRDTLAKNPAASCAHNDLGIIFEGRHDYAAATAQFSAAVQSDPDNALARVNLGQALALNGKFAEAEPHFLVAIRLMPADPLAHKAYADALRRQGRNREAILHLQVALCLDKQPDVQTRQKLAEVLFQTGEASQSAGQFRKVLRLDPDRPEALNDLAWLLATSSDDTVRNGAEAVRRAERACHLTAFKQTQMISALAAAYAEAGRFPEAVATAEMAVRLQTANGETQLAAINNQLLPLYRTGRPYHERPALAEVRNVSSVAN